jgi:ABC-type nitrate/sulfonate/bicarbonate transport system substrate-binding protein
MIGLVSRRTTRRQKAVAGFLIAVFVTALLSAVALNASTSRASTRAEEGHPPVVPIAFITSLVMTALYSTPNYTSAITPKLVPFKSGVDEARALDTGDVAVAPLAYIQFLIGLSQGEDWVAISGVARGGLEIVARPGIIPSGQIDKTNTRYTGTKPWELLRGKTMAALRGTFPDVACRKYLLQHGLTPDKDVKIVTVPSFQDINVGMAKGDIDAACNLDPFPLIARDSGWGVLIDYPYPKGTVTAYPKGGLNYLQLSTVLVTRRATLQKHPDQLQAAVSALVKGTKELNKKPSLWLSRASQYLAFDPKIMALGIDPKSQGKDPRFYGGNYLDTNMYIASLKKWAPVLKTLGYSGSDVSSIISQHVNYRFLRKATGINNVNALGKNR